MVANLISGQKLVLFFACTLLLAHAKVMVYSPQELKDAVKSRKGDLDGFEVSLANFGVIPYGHSLIGRIYYDSQNADGCMPFEAFDYSKDPDDEKHPTPIILVDRGNCTFVKKVRHIEHAGGRLGIVMDNKNENVSSVIMSDDGTGMGINIPSLLIGKTDGEILKNFLEEHGGYHYLKKCLGGSCNRDSNDEDQDDLGGDDEIRKKIAEQSAEDRKLVEQASLLVTFELPRPDNRVEYDIWYSSVDDRALDFIVDFQEFDEKLGDSVLMTPHFVSWKCNECEEEFKKTECYGDGEFCAILHPKAKLDGQKIIQEDLRQKCIYNKFYKKNKNIFWEYVKSVHQNCKGYINDDCSKFAHKKLSLDFKETMQCVSDTFAGSKLTNFKAQNEVLSEERRYWNEYGANFYPSIVINNRTYRGSFEPDAVFNSLCAGFKNAPYACNDVVDQNQFISKSVIIYVVLGLILLNAILIFCYRRISKREMKEDIRMHVNSAVSQYFAISQRENA